MIVSNKRITKALTKLHKCAGPSDPLLLANPEDRFLHVEVHIKEAFMHMGKVPDQLKN